MSTTTNNTSTVKCPRCRRSQKKRGENSIYWCDVCRAQFDDDPDEGGTYSDRSPSARLEREERWEEERRRRQAAAGKRR